MKKILYTAVLCLLATLSAQAQGAWDALRYSQRFYEGTARSLALGNAVTALGGDFGALALNPAASALYSYSEFTFSPSLSSTDVQGEYLNRTSAQNSSKVGISSLGYVGATGAFSFALGANRVNDFNHYGRVGGTTRTSWLSPLAAQTAGIPSVDMESSGGYNPYHDSNAPWASVLAWNTYLLDLLPDTDDQYIAATENLMNGEIFVPGDLNQQFHRQSSGGVTEYLFNAGFNLQNRVFIGFNLNLQSIAYTYKERFVESPQNPDLFDAPLQSFTHQYSLSTTGSGVSLSAGAIFLLGQNARLGLGLSTPTWLRLHDQWSEDMSAVFPTKTERANSPLGEFDYRIRSPWRVNAGFAYTFGSYGFVSVDYEGVNYQGMRLNTRTNSWGFEDENQDILDGGFGRAHNLRMGAELRVTDIAFRVGYALYGSPQHTVARSNVVSCGLGYRSASSFFADLGLSYRMEGMESFTLYDNVGDIWAPEGSLGTNRTKVILTLGMRF